MKLVASMQTIVGLALAVFGFWLYSTLSFCFEPAPFRFAARVPDCYLVNTSQPQLGLVLGFITAAGFATLALISAIGLFRLAHWARSVAALGAIGGAFAFLALGSIASGLRVPFYVAAVLLSAMAGVVWLCTGPNQAFNATARKRAAR